MDTYRREIKPLIDKVVELSDADLSLLLTCVTTRQVKKGDVLLKEGEIASGFFLVRSGYLRTWYNKDGVAINLHFTFEGEYTSNIKSFRDRIPSESIIEAGEDGEVWVFNLRSTFSDLKQMPTIGRFVRRVALDYLLAVEAHNEQFKISTAAERYRYIEEHQPHLLQRIPLTQLASYLGVTRETLSRIRGRH